MIPEINLNLTQNKIGKKIELAPRTLVFRMSFQIFERRATTIPNKMPIIEIINTSVKKRVERKLLGEYNTTEYRFQNESNGWDVKIETTYCIGMV